MPSRTTRPCPVCGRRMTKPIAQVTCSRRCQARRRAEQDAQNERPILDECGEVTPEIWEAVLQRLNVRVIS